MKVTVFQNLKKIKQEHSHCFTLKNLVFGLTKVSQILSTNSAFN